MVPYGRQPRRRQRPSSARSLFDMYRRRAMGSGQPQRPAQRPQQRPQQQPYGAYQQPARNPPDLAALTSRYSGAANAYRQPSRQPAPRNAYRGNPRGSFRYQ